MSTFLQMERTVEAKRWGLTWGEMKEVAEWLGGQGVPFHFDSKYAAKDYETDGLPGLWIYDRRWTPYEVRRGDWLVRYDQGDVRVFSNQQFREEFVTRSAA